MIGLSLLERYVFGKVMMALGVATGALLGVLWVVRAVQQINIVMTNGQGMMTYLQMTALGVPTLSIAIIPVGLLIAFARTINTLNSDSELVVMHASGASRNSLIKPFLAAGLVTAVMIYFLALFIGPLSMQNLRSHITSMRADLFSFVIRIASIFVIVSPPSRPFPKIARFDQAFWAVRHIHRPSAQP